MVRRLLPLTLALLAGCASAPSLVPAPRPVMVKVPVFTPVYCEVKQPPPPSLPVAKLGADSAPADTMRAYVASVILLKGALEQSDALLNGCAEPKAANKSSPVTAANPSTP
ncbi:MAG: hypothetical protein ACREQE_07365 [Candidatus Binataceae bacterium]